MKVDIPIPEGINVAAIPLDFVRFVEFKPVVKRTQPSVVAVIKKAPAMGGCKACGKYHRYCFTVPNMVLRGGVRLFRNDGKDGDIIPYQREFPAGWLGLAEFGDYRDKGYLVFERVNGNEWKPAINKRPQIFLYIISTTLSSRQKAAGINVKESEGVLAKRSACIVCAVDSYYSVAMWIPVSGARVKYVKTTNFDEEERYVIIKWGSNGSEEKDMR